MSKWFEITIRVLEHDGDNVDTVWETPDRELPKKKAIEFAEKFDDEIVRWRTFSK